jgi:hypothetical protein
MCGHESASNILTPHNRTSMGHRTSNSAHYIENAFAELQLLTCQPSAAVLHIENAFADLPAKLQFCTSLRLQRLRLAPMIACDCSDDLLKRWEYYNTPGGTIQQFNNQLLLNNQLLFNNILLLNNILHLFFIGIRIKD